MQFERFYSLNQTVVAWFAHLHQVGFQPTITNLDYQGNKSTPMVDLTSAKLIINSTISTPGAQFLGIDLANFYLNTPMPNPEYMHLRLNIILTLSLLTAGFTLRFERECMVFPKPESLQITYPKSSLPPKGTTNANIHLVSGATSGETSHSAQWWMILAS